MSGKLPRKVSVFMRSGSLWMRLKRSMKRSSSDNSSIGRCSFSNLAIRLRSYSVGRKRVNSSRKSRLRVCRSYLREEAEGEWVSSQTSPREKDRTNKLQHLVSADNFKEQEIGVKGNWELASPGPIIQL